MAWGGDVSDASDATGSWLDGKGDGGARGVVIAISPRAGDAWWWRRRRRIVEQVYEGDYIQVMGCTFCLLCSRWQ